MKILTHTFKKKFVLYHSYVKFLCNMIIYFTNNLKFVILIDIRKRQTVLEKMRVAILLLGSVCFCIFLSISHNVNNNCG